MTEYRTQKTDIWSRLCPDSGQRTAKRHAECGSSPSNHSPLVLVLGLGETGLSMLRWLHAQGARLRVADSRVQPPGRALASQYVAAGEIYCGRSDVHMLEGIELVAISPGVSLADPLVKQAASRGIPVVGDIELFARQLGNREAHGRAMVIAITGSNGKTTVTSMVEHLCRAAGKDAVAAGNISPAVLDAVMERGATQPEVWVLELSSFQLETTATLAVDAATVLNISADHLDRHQDIARYGLAKERIFLNCGTQILNRDDGRSMAMALPECEIVTFGLDAPLNGRDWGVVRDGNAIWLALGEQRLLEASELQVVGLHNIANALAALALCRAIDLPLPILLGALRSYRGLPHRVEFVAEIGGIDYYDDSKGTNVGATVAALEGLGGMASGGATAGRKLVLIAGGEGKGQDFTMLGQPVARYARAVVLIGRDGPQIAAALDRYGVPLVHAADMRDAVRRAVNLAQAGDAVLLSPACASFDMFRNYEHRAESFIKAVHEQNQAPLLQRQTASGEGA